MWALLLDSLFGCPLSSRCQFGGCLWLRSTFYCPGSAHWWRIPLGPFLLTHQFLQARRKHRDQEVRYIVVKINAEYCLCGDTWGFLHKHKYCSIMWVLWSLEIEQEPHTHFKLFGCWLHCPVLVCCLRSNFGSFKNWCKMMLIKSWKTLITGKLLISCVSLAQEDQPNFFYTSAPAQISQLLHPQV